VKPEVSEEKGDWAGYLAPFAGSRPADCCRWRRDPRKDGVSRSDLRQPVMSISGYVSLLLGESWGWSAECKKKFLERIQASCERWRPCSTISR